MKKIWIGLSLTVISLFLSQGAFAASTTGPMTNKATVAGICSMTVNGIDFGTLSSTGQNLANASLVINCSNGTAYTAFLNAGGNSFILIAPPIVINPLPVLPGAPVNPAPPGGGSTGLRRRLKKTGGTEMIPYDLKMDSASGPNWGTGTTNGVSCPAALCNIHTPNSMLGKPGLGNGADQTLTIFGSTASGGSVIGTYIDVVKAILIF